MPIYEYRCPNGHTFERWQSMSAPDPESCDVCDAGPVEKVLYPVAVHYKGSGFYSTDYGRGSKKKDAAAGGEAGASTGGEAGAKSDSGSTPSSAPEPKKAAEA